MDKIGRTVFPEGTNGVLTAYIPNVERDVLELDRLNIEPDRGDGGHNFAELQL
jgi:hypothetical protein